MVDVGDKKVTQRTACAQSVIDFPPSLTEVLTRKHGNTSNQVEIESAKGPVFTTAIIAGTMGAKKTSELIPFCHPLPVEKCKFEIEFDPELPNRVVIKCTVGTTHKTGVEMEALTGASIAALAVYDMCKAMSHSIVISETKLISKTGGKSDFKAS